VAPTKIKVQETTGTVTKVPKTQTFEKLTGITLLKETVDEKTIQKLQAPTPTSLFKITQPTKTKTDEISPIKTSFLPATSYKAAQRIITRQITAERTSYYPPSQITLPIAEIPPPPPTGFGFPKGKKKKGKKKGLLEGYDVFIKRAGKFFKVSKKPLPKYKALFKGAKLTDITPAATFSIKKAGKKIKGKGKMADLLGWKALQQRFYQKGENKYIEKKRYRLSAMGEITGISYKGLQKLSAFPLLRKKKSKRKKKKRR